MLDKILYAAPYLIIAFILFLLYYQEQYLIKQKKSPTPISISAFIILWLFLGLRGHIYTDFISYYSFYEKLTPIFQPNVSEHYYEPGFVLFSKIIKTFIPNYHGWILINTFIDLYALRFIFKRYCSSTILPFIFFLAFQGVMMEANLMRNMKALDCFFFSIPYLIDRKIFKYLLLNIIGIFFHFSAILFIPFYFILMRHLHKYFIWGMFVFVSVIYWGNLHFTSSLLSKILITDIAIERFQGYLESDQGYGFTFGYFERTATLVLFTIFSNSLIKKHEYNTVFYNCAFWYYISHLLFDDIALIAERVPFLFIIGYWTLYPNIVSLKSKYRPVINYSIGILVSMKIFLSYSSNASKYQNIIFGIDSYEKRSNEVMESFLDFQSNR